jgi:hypothetical protein
MPAPALAGPHMTAVVVPPVHALAGRLYAWCVRGAAWLDGHRLLAAGVGAPLVVAVLAALNQWVLLGFANSGDEYLYLFQARTLTAGRLWHATPALASSDLFTTNYMAVEAGRMYGTFPPGWPLALAAALAAGVPAWLVNPVLGAVTLALVWTLGHQLHGPRAGVLAAIVVGVSPFFAFNAASYFSHTFCGALVLGAACLAARADRRPAWVPLLVGAAIGWAILARYLTGVVCAVPIVWWLLRPGVDRLRTVLLVVLGGLPWALGLVAYNMALGGRPWRLTTTDLTLTRWFADGVLLRGADILASHLVRHLLWTPPVLIVAYVVYLRAGAREARKGLLAWLPVLMAAVLYGYVERGGNQYGARFHAEVFPFLVIFVTAHVFRTADYAAMRASERLMFGLLAISVAVMPVAFVAHGLIEREVIEERMHPFTLVSALALQGALVFVDGRVGSRRSMAAADYTRNAPGLDGPVLFAVDPGAGRRCPESARLPDRRPFVYRWDVRRRRGELTPVPCP